MTGFPLLKSLQNLKEEKSGNQKLVELKKSIKYDEYELELFNNRTKTVFIPQRVSEKFEADLDGCDFLTETHIKTLLRKFNGVTEI